MLRQRITSQTTLQGIPTVRYQLPRVGQYTAFELAVHANRYLARADNTVVYPLESQISKIEVLKAGAQAVISLTPSQLMASNFWDFRHIPPMKYRQKADQDNCVHLFLLGGRDLYDRVWGYNMEKLGETFLEYSHSMSTDTAEKFDVSTHTITLYGWRWMGPDIPNFLGYRRIRQLTAWTTSAADALKPVGIPIGLPVRRIGVQAKTASTTIGGTVKEIVLKVNEDEYSPVHIKSPLHWVMGEVCEYDLDNELEGLDYLFNSSAHILPDWFSYWMALTCNAYVTAQSYYCTEGFVGLPASLCCTGTAGQEAVFTGRGYGFQKCLRIGFDHDYNGFDLFPTKGLGALDLEMTEAAASKDGAVFAEDIVPY